MKAEASMGTATLATRQAGVVQAGDNPIAGPAGPQTADLVNCDLTMKVMT